MRSILYIPRNLNAGCEVEIYNEEWGQIYFLFGGLIVRAFSEK